MTLPLHCSNVAFRVHRSNLTSGSVVFRDMFQTETAAGGTEIEVAEDAEVLEMVLPYCYPEPVDPGKLKYNDMWKAVKVFDKYQASHRKAASYPRCCG